MERCVASSSPGGRVGSTWPPPRWGQHYPFKTTTTPLTGFVSLDEGSQSYRIHTQYHRSDRTQYYSLMCIYYLPRRRRPGTGDIATPPVRPSVRLSVCLSVTFSFRTVTQKRIAVFSRNFAGTCTKSWGVLYSF